MPITTRRGVACLPFYACLALPQEVYESEDQNHFGNKGGCKCGGSEPLNRTSDY